MIRIVTFAFFFLSALSVIAQVNQQKVDSLKIALSAAKGEDKTEVYVRLIEAYEYDDKTKAANYTQELIDYGRTNNLQKPEIRGILIKAQSFTKTSQYDSAHCYYDKALAKLNTIEDYQLQSIYYGDKGVLNFYQGDFKEALNNFDSALELAREYDKKDDILRYLNNKALAMSYLGQAEESIDVHKEAIDLAIELKDSTAMGRSFNNLGLIYEDMNAFEKALEFYEKALLIKRNHGTPQDILNGKYNIAGMHKELADKNKDTVLLNRAEVEFEQLILDAENENYGKVVLFAKKALAQVATSKQEFQKAIDLYLSVIVDAESQNDNQVLRVTYLNIGTNYFELENYERAKNYLQLAEPHIEESENPSDQSKLYKNLSKTNYQLGNYKEAYEYNLKYTESSGSLISDELQEKITDFEVKYETEQKENQILEQRAELAEKDLEVRRKNAYIFGSLGLAIILGLLGYLIYSRQKLKNQQLKKENELQVALAKIETQNRLEEQRLRISRDLHDNIGSQLTFIISSIDNLKFKLQNLDSKIADKLTEISLFTVMTINELRDTIWAMNKEVITVEDLQTRISNFVERAQSSSSDVNFQFVNKNHIKKGFEFSAVEGINIYRIVQEAINNTLKYAIAKTIIIEMQVLDVGFKILIIDDGKGFDLDNYSSGFGISNMQKRADDIDADFEIKSTEKCGTTILLQSKN